MKHFKQAGFTAIEAIIIIFIMGALLGVGIWVVKNQSDENKTTETSQTNDQSTDAPEAPSVEDNQDLETAEKALDDSNLNAGTTDNSDLDSQTSGF